MSNITLFFRLVPTGGGLFPPSQGVSTYMTSKFEEKQEATAYSRRHISVALKNFY